MLKPTVDHLFRMSKIILGELKIIPESIKIFFSAPNPKSPESQSLDIKPQSFDEANFQWFAYQVLFSMGEKFYIYNINLKSNGEENPPSKVFESDYLWSAKNKNIPSKDVTSGDVITNLPKLLKGKPNINPIGIIKKEKIFYINTDTKDDGHRYSYDEFKNLFDKDFYIVLDPKSKELKKPFGDPVGKKYPKQINRSEQNIKIEKSAQNIKDIQPLSGGRDIMKKLVQKLNGKKMPKNPDYVTDGFGIVQKLRKKAPPEKAEGIGEGFDVVKQLSKKPVPIK